MLCYVMMSFEPYSYHYEYGERDLNLYWEESQHIVVCPSNKEKKSFYLIGRVEHYQY